MTADRFRKRERRDDGTPFAGHIAAGRDPDTVMVIDSSPTLTLLLSDKIRARIGAKVLVAHSQAEAMELIGREKPSLAICGLALADALRGEILDTLSAVDVPALVFTATIDRRTRLRLTGHPVVDYFTKDSPGAVDSIIAAAGRFLDNYSTGVLIVDDMQSARALLGNIVRRCNYRVFEAGSGQEALDLIQNNPAIDLVITDFHMPDMDGQELTRRIRASYSADVLRVIGISGSTDPFLSAALLKAGASDFIYRPFVDEEVKVRVENNIENLRLIRTLRFYAERDPLSGLMNRRAFFDKAPALLDQNNGNGWVAIVDIDHFKSVNDRYGHDAGDLGIRALARAIEQMLGQNQAKDPSVLMSRFGGEEFVLLFGTQDATYVTDVCNNLRNSIANLSLMHEGSSFGLTVSIGLAPVTKEDGLDLALSGADRALYAAKHEGRNRVVASG